MDSIRIYGGKKLQGSVRIQGSKNAALPVLAACVLIDGVSCIENCPDIADIHCMIKLLESIGCQIQWKDERLLVDATSVKQYRLPGEYVTRMRSSVILMGALLGRMKKAQLDYPGGCVIGKRPIDLHLKGLRQLGASIEESERSIYAKTDCLKGTNITLAFPSVGATENILLASVSAEGITYLSNYAKEPEIESLVSFLKLAGADIEGFGEETLTITGGQRLHAVTYKIPADRIVAGTYLIGCQAAMGEIYLEDAPAESLQSLLWLLKEMGSTFSIEKTGIHMVCKDRSRPVSHLKTGVYPEFPTDLQSQMLVALSLADGKSIVEETIFESRFKVVKELKNMGADISIESNCASITGISKLRGKHVIAEELRGGAALVLAGICAEGITMVSNKHFIDRGYVNICKDLKELGANVHSY